jgi:hypothetical protein
MRSLFFRDRAHAYGTASCLIGHLSSGSQIATMIYLIEGMQINAGLFIFVSLFSIYKARVTTSGRKSGVRLLSTHP